MKKLETPDKYFVNTFDGVSDTTVYAGEMNGLVNVNSELKWNTNDDDNQMYGLWVGFLTLQEIKEQLSESYALITVITNSPLHGEILQWGNYGDQWWKIGDFSGYA